jgi:uncharacterized membrane protein
MSAEPNAGRPDAWDMAAAVVIAFQAALAVYVARYAPSGPTPMHFDFHGEVDRWATRTEAVVWLAATAALGALIHLLIAVRARSQAASDNPWAFNSGRIVGLAVPALVSILVAALALMPQASQDSDDALRLGAGIGFAILAVIGATLGKIKSNPWIGVRVYWTFKSRLAWDKANRLFGRIAFAGGLAGLLATPFTDVRLLMPVFVTLVVGAAAASIFESWRVWRSDPERRS